MTLETPVWLEAVTGDTAITYSARQLRTWIDAVFASEGVVGPGDLKVTQRAAGANMSVDVAAGMTVITGDSVAFQGKYVARNTAVVNVPITTAPTTGTRTDIIVAKLLDKQADGGTQYAWTISALAGTTVVPPSAVFLGQIAVGANVTSITNSVITDQRALVGLAPGPRPNIQVGFAGSNALNAGGFVGMSGWAVGGVNQGGMVWSSAAGVTVPRGGPYWLGGAASYDTAFSGGRRGVGYLINGSLLSAPAQGMVGDAGPGGTTVTAPAFLQQLSAGDVVNLAVYQSASGQLHVTNAGLSVGWAG